MNELRLSVPLVHRLSPTTGKLLLRHASQNSLDESSQKEQSSNSLGERPVYHNSDHCNKAFAKINQLRKEHMLCDVTLMVQGREFPAHRIILSSCSPYFQAMFANFEESRQTNVVLQDIDAKALEVLLDYVYTSEVQVTEDNVQFLLPAANLLQLTDVKDACCDFLVTQLHPSNCLGIRSFADLHHCPDMYALADKYVEQHFADVAENEEFFNLSCEEVARLVASDKLTVPNEEKVYECVVSWVNYDPEVRTSYLPELMAHVRLPLLSQEYLVQRVEEDPLMKLSSQCKDYLIEALKYHLLKGEQKLLFRTPRTRPRRPSGLPKVLLVVGGQSPKAIRGVECYDFEADRWYSLAEMPTRRCRAGVAVVSGRVYAIGGFNGALRVRSVDMYEPQLDQWFPAPDMESRRSTLGVAVLNNCIYAIGGFDGSSGLNTAELFDPVRQEWSAIAPMSVRRSSVGVAVLDGYIFAVGGYDGASRQCLASVERYDHLTDTWFMVAEMSCRRSGAGVGVLDGFLYAVGGHDGPVVRKSVERYDPKSGVWTPVADMILCRRNAGVVAHEGSLYVVGGDDGTSNLASVEVYNPDSNVWNLLPACMGIGRSYTGVAVINRPF